jgi:hypothetical protein
MSDPITGGEFLFKKIIRKEMFLVIASLVSEYVISIFFVLKAYARYLHIGGKTCDVDSY